MTEPNKPEATVTEPWADQGAQCRRVPEPETGPIPVRRRRFRRTRALFAPVGRVLGKIPHPPWRSKRGIFLLFVLFAGFGAVATMGGVKAVGFSETPSSAACATPWTRS